jgi:hypothetical protein
LIDALAGLTDLELTWELLGAYEACEELSGHDRQWCEMVGLIPSDPASDKAYTLIHNAYADLWLHMGSPAFFTRLYAYRDRWVERRRGSGRTGKPSLVARLTHRRAA